MVLKSRQPSLPTLAMPPIQQPSPEDVRTPLPFTPLPFKQGPLVMTPDTATFELSPLEIVLSGAKRPFGGEGLERLEDVAWTDYEDGLLQSYLAHPPRALNASYPPGTLPPPGALDEITSQLMDAQSRKTTPVESPESEDPSILANPTWRHSWKATRQRLFTIARRESMEATGGHRRQKSDSIVPEVVDAVMMSEKPKWMSLGAKDGGFSLNRRRNDSMDSLYGDAKPDGFSEALKLSISLQCSASGGGSSLTSESGLDSPIHGTFIFNPTRKPFPFTAPTSRTPRPASLLQRGRSFTSADVTRDHGRIDEGNDSDSSASASHSRPRAYTSPRTMVRRYASGPSSSRASSPPSKTTDLDAAPIMPLHKETFGAMLASACSTPMTEVPPVPAMPLTTGALELQDDGEGEGSLRREASNSPSKAFSYLSLSSRSVSNSSLSSCSSSSTITPTFADTSVFTTTERNLPELPPHLVRPPLTSATSFTEVSISPRSSPSSLSPSSSTPPSSTPSSSPSSSISPSSPPSSDSSSSPFSFTTNLGRSRSPRPAPPMRSKSDTGPFGRLSMTSMTSLYGDRDPKRQKAAGQGYTDGSNNIEDTRANPA